MHPLSASVYAAALGDDLVFLQAQADRYLCMPGGARQARLTPDGRGIEGLNPDALAKMQAQRLLGEAAHPTFSWGRPLRPRRDWRAAEARPQPLDLLRLSLAVGDLANGYAFQGLAAILAGVRRTPAQRQPPQLGSELQRLVGVFQFCVPYLPISGKCLVRSFVLLRFLQRSGCNAEWIFGVRTWPFSAHCWLQAEETALDDFADHLRIYEPILSA